MSEENQIEVRQETQVAETTNHSDPMLAMIDRVCSDPNFDVSKMQAIVDMRNSELARVAQVEFARDFAQLSRDLPNVAKDAKGHNCTYATFGNIKETINQSLCDYGFKDLYNIEQNNGTVKVTCTLMHKGGHKESTSITLPYDKTGSKSDVHAIGSAVSYGRRYTLTSLLGIGTNDDDDGQKANQAGRFLSTEQVQEINDRMDDYGFDKMQLCQKLQVSAFSEITATKFQSVINLIEDKRKRESNANT